jgi:hypothetical protein
LEDQGETEKILINAEKERSKLIQEQKVLQEQKDITKAIQ